LIPQPGGVVYKAEDTKLKRLVALKFLPSSIMASEAEKTRFIHEAQAAAALNHPNICTIYKINEIDGQAFIAMEFVEGQSLKEKVASGMLQVANAIDIAIQVAAGLQAAHEKKITHRDIKPANVMLTPKGQVKIMDFGLAKLAGRSALTKEGATLGTVAYMSPEQARGEEVDRRTDIWAFGVVLYEMITGQLPFKGEYEQAVMYSIMNMDPEPVMGLRTGVPVELERMINKALVKKANLRYQNIEDLLVDLSALQLRPKASTGSQPPIKAKVPARKSLWLYGGLAGIGVLLAIVVSVLLLQPKRAPELNPDAAFRVLPIPFAQIGYPGISPDGNWLAFQAADANGKWDVYFMNTSGGEPRRITADSSDYLGSADVSPDGSQVVYDRWDQRLQKAEVCIISSLGGTSKVLAGRGNLPRGPRWRPDGQRIGYMLDINNFLPSKSGKREFWSIRPDGTDNRLEFVDSVGIGGNSSFAWSPNGKSVAWIRTFPARYAEVIVHELETGKERQLTFDKKNIDEVCWTNNEAIIYSSSKGGNSDLWMAPMNGGQTVQITKGIGSETGMRISADGKKLVYLQSQESRHVWLANINGSAGRQITFDEFNAWHPSFSPDGQRLLVCMGGSGLFANTGRPLYMMNRDGSNRQQMTRGDQIARDPLWSPDGKWLAYGSYSTSEPEDSARVYLLEASNPGNPRLLGKGFPGLWIDPQNLIVATSSNTWLFSIDGATPKRLSQDSTLAFPIFGEKNVLLKDLHKGREGWWIIPTKDWHAPATGQPRKILADNYFVDLAPSRKFLFCAEKPGEVWKISLPDGKPARLPGPFPFLEIGFRMSYDGQEIVYVDSRTQGKLVMIENLFK